MDCSAVLQQARFRCLPVMQGVKIIHESIIFHVSHLSCNICPIFHATAALFDYVLQIVFIDLHDFLICDKIRAGRQYSATHHLIA